ncbi:hypothetical protein [Sphingomonas sp.]|uniref:hypothetical protein n=1 Tax=Sphingomonas sp. TaxID=28214 RepID=UPI00333EF319
MIHAGFGLSVLLWSGAAAAEFRPVADRPYRYDTVETRTADGVTRFQASRTIVFHKTDAGFDVTVTLDTIDERAGDDVGAMFRAATGALLHRPIRYRLDASGAIVDVADADAAIALIADAIERISARRARSGDARVLASPLRALPPERKAAMLRSVLTPVLAGAAADRAPGQRAITLPSRPPLAPGTALEGIETTRSAGGIVAIEVRAAGGVDTRAAADTHGHDVAIPAQRPTATITSIRHIDAATGLLRDAHDIAETRLSDGATAHTTQIETILTLQLRPSR